MSTDTETRPAAGPAVGMRLRGHSRTITEADLVGFAALSGDWHPQHVDAEWAAESIFGERVAHGMAVLSYSFGLIAFDPDRVVALRGLDSVRFKRPVRPGETISVEAVVCEVREVDAGLALVSFAWTVRTAGGGAAVKATVVVLWRSADRAPAVGEPARREDRDAGDAEQSDYPLYPGGLLL